MMNTTCIYVSALLLIAAFGSCCGNVPLHGGLVEKLNAEVKEKVLLEAFNLFNATAVQLEAESKDCSDKTDHWNKICAKCEVSIGDKKLKRSQLVLIKVKKIIKDFEKKLKKILGYERLKKAWKKVENVLKKFKKPLKNLGKAARKLTKGVSRAVRRVAKGVSRAVRRIATGVSRSLRRAVRGIRRAIRRVRIRIRVRSPRVRIPRIRVRLPRIRTPRVRFGSRRWGKKRDITEPGVCNECGRLADMTEEDSIATVCGKTYKREMSRMMTVIKETENLLGSLEKDDNDISFVTKVEYDTSSALFSNGQIAFKESYITLQAKRETWIFKYPKPLKIVPFETKELAASISKQIMQKYVVN